MVLRVSFSPQKVGDLARAKTQLGLPLWHSGGSANLRPNSGFVSKLTEPLLCEEQKNDGTFFA